MLVLFGGSAGAAPWLGVGVGAGAGVGEEGAGVSILLAVGERIFDVEPLFFWFRNASC